MHRILNRLVIFSWIAVSAFGVTVLAEAPIRGGDRVAIMGNTFADQLRIHGYLENLLLQHTQENPVSIRNLGWGGDTLSNRDRPTNFPTEESTLQAHKTDVIVACFGMGESFAGENGLADFESELKSFINSHVGKSYNGKTNVRLILVSPIAHEDLGNLTPTREGRNKDLKKYTDAMNKVAREADIPFVDLYEPTLYLMNEPAGPKLTTNGIHLNPLGYWAISRVFYDNLISDETTLAHQPWHLFIDAKLVSAQASGVTIREVSYANSQLSFTVDETTGPTPKPPTHQTLSAQLNHQRDTLIVVGLSPGEHTLVIDGQSVVTASDGAWAEGVPIDSSPAHQQAESRRQAINDKNLQFTYSWKALNQVHIVGERRSSKSGQALPGEVIEFKNLADRRDRELAESIQLKARHWRLVPKSP